MSATEQKRHPGRRKPATEKAEQRHLKLIREAEKKRRKLEEQADKQVTVLAERIDKAMQDGVQTNRIGDGLGISRQMVYKLVRERVDGRPLGGKRNSQNNGANG